MKKQGYTLFAHILVITLIPVTVVFSVVIITLNGILNMSVGNQTKETVRQTAAQISEQAGIRLQAIESMLQMTSINMAEGEKTRQTQEALLRTMLRLMPDAYTAWFVFEPGIYTTDGRFHKEWLRMPTGEYKNITTYTETLLDKVSWYQFPLRSGEMFYDALNQYDYAQGEGSISILSMTMPIERDGKVIGCVGVDVRYEALLRLDRGATSDLPQKIMVVSDEGTVLFSFDTEDIGKTLDDFEFDDKTLLYHTLEKNELWLDEINSPFFATKSLAVLYPFHIHEMNEPVYLYRGVSREELFEKFRPSVEIVYMAGIIGTLLIGFWVFVAARRITRHAKQITTSFRLAAHVEEGSAIGFEQISMVDTNINELNQLQSSLKAIMVQIQEAHILKIQSIEATVENEKLVASSQAKTSFFAAMSHEIRTPMNAIIGIAEILLHRGGLSDEQEKYIRDIGIASGSLLTIINDIMDVSKMETGKISLQMESYDFLAMIENVAVLTQHLATEAGLKFTLDMEASLPRCLYGDGTRVRQVLLNLLGNAVKYTRKGFVALHIYAENGKMRFDVIDSGIGIKEKDISSVFESFKRVDVKRNQKIMGTGLGLSICKHLVEIMDGSISATSYYGSGSTFSVSLPITLGNENELRKVKVAKKLKFSEDLRILVVDDNEINLNVAGGLLKVLCGIQCATALSGKEAITKVQETDYDLVFMDHMMPEMDGVDTTRYIRGLGEKFKRLPIIALTANAVSGMREELLAAGLDGFVSKPIRREDLWEVLHEWVPQEKQTLVQETEEESAAAEAAASSNSIAQAKSAMKIDVEVPLGSGMSVTDPRVVALAGVREISLDVGLENIGYDEDMYYSSVKLLCQKIPQTIQHLQDTLAAEDMKNFQIYVHGCKGSFASIGALDLLEHALNLELAASRGDVLHCKENLPDLIVLMEQFRDSLDAVIQQLEPKPEDPLLTRNPNHQKMDLVKLHDALKSYDYERITEEWAVISALSWSEEDKAFLAELEEAVINFDYSAAVNMLSDRNAQ